jgi:hypothetical protein
MPTFAVVMVTQGNRPTQAAAEASVHRQLPAGIDFHVLLDKTTDGTLAGWNDLIWKSRDLADFVAFVDDDDLVENDSIAILQQCILSTHADVAFTCERVAHADGRTIADRMPRQTPTYGDIAMYPMASHHLAFLRTAHVAPEALVMHANTGAPVDWTMRAWVATHGRAMHVPIVGYTWLKYDGKEPGVPRSAYQAAGLEMVKWAGARAVERVEVWNP